MWCMKRFQSVACEKSYMDVAAVAPKAGKSSSSGLLFIVLTVKAKTRSICEHSERVPACEYFDLQLLSHYS